MKIERIAAIDLGTNCGLVLGDHKGSIEKVSAVNLKRKDHTHPGDIWMSWEITLNKFLHASFVDLIVYEGVYRFMSSAAALRYGGLAAILERHARVNMCEIEKCSPKEWRKIHIGNGNASKEDVKRLVLAEENPELFDKWDGDPPDDITDAIGIYRWKVGDLKRQSIEKRIIKC